MCYMMTALDTESDQQHMKLTSHYKSSQKAVISIHMLSVLYSFVTKIFLCKKRESF